MSQKNNNSVSLGPIVLFAILLVFLCTGKCEGPAKSFGWIVEQIKRQFVPEEPEGPEIPHVGPITIGPVGLGIYQPGQPTVSQKSRGGEKTNLKGLKPSDQVKNLNYSDKHFAAPEHTNSFAAPEQRNYFAEPEQKNYFVEPEQMNYFD
jgi:hypothetical protein